MKNIVVCCDGTKAKYGAEDENTNVVRLFERLGSDGEEQISFYDPGVGTYSPQQNPLKRWWEKAKMAASGQGTMDNVQEAYKYLMECYDPGDKVYFFGYSRGAYTVRILADMLHRCGLLTKGSNNLVPYATEIYGGKDKEKAAGFKGTFSRECKPHFIGVWDTVASTGWLFWRVSFSGRILNGDVANGYHAVSVDEKRSHFPALGRLLGLVNRDAKLICVSRWRRREIASGISDRECRELVVGRGGEFRLHQSLHAKYYRFGNVVLVGSANLTGAGMGYSLWPNLETLCPPWDGFDWGQLEARLVSESYVLGDAEYLRWQQIEITGRSLGFASKDEGPSEPEPVGWEPRTREPDNLWLAYRGSEQDIPGGDERRVALTDLDEVGLPPGLERQDFDNWIVGALLESAWVGRIRSLWGRDRMEVRALLEIEWGMDPSRVERARQTLEAWIQRYLL